MHIWSKTVSRVGQGGKCEMAVRDPGADLPAALESPWFRRQPLQIFIVARPWGHRSPLRAMVFAL